jgi:hypothetical protein
MDQYILDCSQEDPQPQLIINVRFPYEELRGKTNV